MRFRFRQARGGGSTWLRTRRRAFFTLDIIAAIGLGMVLMLAFSLGVRYFAQISDECDTRRVLRLAAEHELDRLRAGISEPDSVIQRDGCQLEVSRAPGVDVWSGLEHVRVVARKPARKGRWVGVELSAYLEPRP
ncbi:MAG TPA: hypothetical protein VGM03_06530 [Phycisphaerae bacterium]|jgi:hypothetical protein